jgi:hypothetical protein
MPHQMPPCFVHNACFFFFFIASRSSTKTCRDAACARALLQSDTMPNALVTIPGSPSADKDREAAALQGPPTSLMAISSGFGHGSDRDRSPLSPPAIQYATPTMEIERDMDSIRQRGSDLQRQNSNRSLGRGRRRQSSFARSPSPS